MTGTLAGVSLSDTETVKEASLDEAIVAGASIAKPETVQVADLTEPSAEELAMPQELVRSTRFHGVAMTDQTPTRPGNSPLTNPVATARRARVSQPLQPSPPSACGTGMIKRKERASAAAHSAPVRRPGARPRHRYGPDPDHKS